MTHIIFYPRHRKLMTGLVMLISFFILFVAFGEPQERHVSSGKLISIPDFKSQYVSARNVDIWLPEGYDVKNNYAVLYMHDGQSLFDSLMNWNGQEWGVDETMSKLMKDNKIRNTIVVGIWNSGKNRQSDYFPQKPFDALPEKTQDSVMNTARIHQDMPIFGTEIQSDNYLAFIVKELKPYIDKNYSTKKEAADTFIAGSSFGGLISIYAICEYPEVFGGAACLSTHWTGIFTSKNNPIPKTIAAYLSRELPDPENHKIYFDYGTRTLDSLYEPYQKMVDSVMIGKGFDESNWQTKKFEGADHSERSWMKRLEYPMTFLLSDPDDQVRP